MLDPAIQSFLDDRKAIWLKKKITNQSSEQEIAEFEQQALEQFSLAGWLPSAAERAKQLSLVSHPGKFSHPSAKISSIIARAPRAADGFVRTGNIEAELDVFGNAAAMDVYKFLTITLADNRTLLNHLEEKTSEIKQQLSIPSVSFEEIEQGLMAIKNDSDSTVKTSDKVKQVYFPVEGDYHLLSLLTPSNLMYKLKERINVMRFSDEAKEARESKKKNQLHDTGLSEVYGLTVIGYGGTKPQNISVLNSKNGGAAYLLSSMPPQLDERKVQPPRSNFFVDSLWLRPFESEFKKLHQLLVNDRNNKPLRLHRDWIIHNIIYQVIDRVWLIRSLPKGWSDSDNYQQLSKEQKQWLDQQYEFSREEDREWLIAIKRDLVRWIINSYEKVLGSDSVGLGDEQNRHLLQLIDECEEALR